MRLTVQSDYAMRMLMMLATNRDRLTTISEVADRFDVSKNHLMKVAQTLVHMSLIESTRGRSGGLRLAREPDQISVGKTLRVLEANSSLVECMAGGDGVCILDPACRLKRALANAQEQFFLALDPVSIQDLTEKNSFILDLLSIEDAA